MSKCEDQLLMRSYVFQTPERTPEATRVATTTRTATTATTGPTSCSTSPTGKDASPTSLRWGSFKASFSNTITSIVLKTRSRLRHHVCRHPNISLNDWHYYLLRDEVFSLFLILCVFFSGEIFKLPRTFRRLKTPLGTSLPTLTSALTWIKLVPNLREQCTHPTAVSFK